jgi:hypothetical protein
MESPWNVQVSINLKKDYLAVNISSYLGGASL